MEKYYKQFELCRQNEKPYCMDHCPFQLDVLDFLEKVKSERYNAAYKTYRNAVVFPEIVANLCPQYCSYQCPRAAVDQAVQINLLEKSCIAKTTKKDPTDYNLPMKGEHVGIIGGGMAGLACALRLASKKYKVTIYEKSSKLGGKLWKLMPSEIFLKDIQRQFQFEQCTLHLNTQVNDIQELTEEFDAIFIATGKGGADFHLLDEGQSPCCIKGKTGIFAGGSLLGLDMIPALANGIKMAWSIEVFLKTKKLEYPVKAQESKVVVAAENIIKEEAILPTENGIFTKEEATKEAERCIKCQCDGCMVYCDIVGFYDKWPLQLRDEITTTTMASESLVHKTPAVRLINSCTQCGLCKEVCPGEIELEKMIQAARYKMHGTSKMPGAFRQYWINDMEFSNGAYAAISKNAFGCSDSKYAFFPGCNLGAENIEYVTKPYHWLLSKDSGVGLMLRCCSIPASWAGDESLHREELDKLCSDWEHLGKPVLIIACMSCMKHLKEYLPKIPTISLYEIMDQWGMEGCTQEEGVYSIFDPCSARHQKAVQGAVRNLSGDHGYRLKELPKADKHGCCGFGGQGSIANPEFAAYAAKKRGDLSKHPYIVYCINCKNAFQKEQKNVLHVLDFLFHIKGKSPTETERRKNRVMLKETLLKELWGEDMSEKPKENTFHLIIGKEIQEKMDHLKILDENICFVLEMGEINKRRTYNQETDSYKCYREIGYITCWVEYKILESGYEILNVYTHRMKIELEGIWNGKKANIIL